MWGMSLFPAAAKRFVMNRNVSVTTWAFVCREFWRGGLPKHPPAPSVPPTPSRSLPGFFPQILLPPE